MIRSVMYVVQLNGQARVTLVQPNPKRVALLFSPPTAGAYTVSLNNNIEEKRGINLVAGAAAVLLTRAEFGDGLDRAWYAVAVAGSGSPAEACALESFEM